MTSRHPRRRRRRCGGQFDLRQRDKLLRLAVLEHGEIRHRQPADRSAVVVEDGDVEVEDLDAGLERRRRRLLLLLLLSKGPPRSARRMRTSHQGFQRTSFVTFVSFVVESFGGRRRSGDERRTQTPPCNERSQRRISSLAGLAERAYRRTARVGAKGVLAAVAEPDRQSTLGAETASGGLIAAGVPERGIDREARRNPD